MHRLLELLDAEVSTGLVRRLRLERYLGRFNPRYVWAAFMFVNGFVSIAVLSALALFTGTPFVFPSLGPTAFLFFVTPTSPTASPHHAILGHAIGLGCGYGSLLLFGLTDAGPTIDVGVSLARVGAAALALAATGALMILAKCAHTPAGATTLIVALGLVTKPASLLVLELAVVLLTIQAFVVNRLAGLDYPLWARRLPAAVAPASPGGPPRPRA